MDKQEVFDNLIEYIHSAIESEQDEPKEFSNETELRLKFVCVKLREALGIDPIA